MSALASKFGHAWIFFSAVVSSLIVALILGFLVFSSRDAVAELGPALFSLQWHPAGGQFGVLTMVYGSLVVTLIALCVAVPPGILAAIFTAEILPARLWAPVKSFLEILAGIPSIIYGLIGVAFVSVWIGDLFDLQSGRTILTAGLLLAVMILPTVITLTDDALHRVPQQYREAARGLGLYPYEVICSAVLPIARRDIAGAVLLALGRALGETMAVMLVIGSIDRLPQPLYNILVPAQTITSKLGREIAEAAFGSLHFSALIFLGLMLLITVLALTLGTHLFLKPAGGRLYE